MSLVAHPSTVEPRVRRATPTRRLTVEWRETIEGWSALHRAWDVLALRLDAGVEATPSWQAAWWTRYGGSATPRLAVARMDERIVGVVGWFIETLRFGPYSVRVARPVATIATQSVWTPPIEAAWAEGTWRQMIAWLIEIENVDLIVMGPTSDQVTHQAIRSAVDRSSHAVARLIRDRDAGVRNVFELPDSVETWRSSLSRNQRSNLGRGERRLAPHRPRTEIIDAGARLTDEFDAFVALHERQWHARGRQGHFREWPGGLAFHQDLLHRLGAEHRVRLLRLEVGGHVIARQYAHVAGRSAACRLAARDPDPAWDRVGLGRLSLVALLEHFIETGVRRVDAGVGQYDYKTRLGATIEPLRLMTLAAPTRRSSRRARLLAMAADTIDRLYYRFFYCRVAPCVRWRRPLASAWIRTRC